MIPAALRIRLEALGVQAGQRVNEFPPAGEAGTKTYFTTKIQTYASEKIRKYLCSRDGVKKRMCQHMRENSPHLMAHPFFYTAP